MRAVEIRVVIRIQHYSGVNYNAIVFLFAFGGSLEWEEFFSMAWSQLAPGDTGSGLSSWRFLVP